MYIIIEQIHDMLLSNKKSPSYPPTYIPRSWLQPMTNKPMSHTVILSLVKRYPITFHRSLYDYYLGLKIEYRVPKIH